MKGEELAREIGVGGVTTRLRLRACALLARWTNQRLRQAKAKKYMYPLALIKMANQR